MRSERLTRLWDSAKHELQKHWEASRREDLGEQVCAAQNAVTDVLEDYFDVLRILPSTANDNTILGAMREMLNRLNEINSELNYHLIESDERKLIVPLAIQAAEIAGLDPGRYPDRDPTQAFRTF